jgi:DNA-binding transcriptional LysR family regulator
VRAAVATAVSGCGLTRLYSYHVAEYVKDGRLKIVLADAEHPPLPVHLLTPPGRMAVPKVPAFIDFAVPRLRSSLLASRPTREHFSADCADTRLTVP